MKKLLLVGLSACWLTVGMEESLAMNSDHVSNENTSSANPVMYQAFAGTDQHNFPADLSNQAELFMKIESLTTHMLSQDQSIKDLKELIVDLKQKNDELSAENNALRTEINEIKNSTDKALLEETKRANALKQQEIEFIRQKEAHNQGVDRQLHQLEIEMDDWSKYIDGRRVVKKNWLNSYNHNPILQNAAEVARFNERQKQAPHQIDIIKEKMANIRSSRR